MHSPRHAADARALGLSFRAGLFEHWRCRAEAGQAPGPCLAGWSAAPAGCRAESLRATEEGARFGRGQEKEEALSTASRETERFWRVVERQARPNDHMQLT